MERERENADRLEREEKGTTEVENRKERGNRTKDREEMTMDEDENCLPLQLILPQNTFQLLEQVRVKEEEMKRVKEKEMQRMKEEEMKRMIEERENGNLRFAHMLQNDFPCRSN